MSIYLKKKIRCKSCFIPHTEFFGEAKLYMYIFLKFEFSKELFLDMKKIWKADEKKLPPLLKLLKNFLSLTNSIK